MKKLKLIAGIGLLIIFPGILLYGYIAVAGLTAVLVFKAFASVIRLNYSIYIILESIFTALASGALFGIIFGYLFTKRAIIFSAIISATTALLLYLTTYVPGWKPFVDYAGLILCFVAFSGLGSIIKKRRLTTLSSRQ